MNYKHIDSSYELRDGYRIDVATHECPTGSDSFFTLHHNGECIRVSHYTHNDPIHHSYKSHEDALKLFAKAAEDHNQI